MPTITCIDDLQRLARRRVPRMFYDYVDSGAWTESTYRANANDFSNIGLRQRVMVDMSNRRLESKMLGERVSLPLALAPTGLTGSGHWARRVSVNPCASSTRSWIPPWHYAACGISMMSIPGSCAQAAIPCRADPPPRPLDSLRRRQPGTLAWRRSHSGLVVSAYHIEF